MIETKNFSPSIKVIGAGGGAINAVNHMIDYGVHGVDFIAVSIDKYRLEKSKVPAKIHIGKNRIIGLGQLPVTACRDIAEKERDIFMAAGNTASHHEYAFA